jgi:hypothetical protein
VSRPGAEVWPGELGHLAAISPTVRRLALDLTDRQATALATAIDDTTALPRGLAEIHGIALAGVFRIIIGEAGGRTLEGQDQERIADELHTIVENVLDDLDRWFTPAEPPR